MENVIYELSYVIDIFITCVTAGFFIGGIVSVVGLGVHGVINIFKKI